MGFALVRAAIAVASGQSTLGADGGFTHVSENEPGECGTDKDVFDLAELQDNYAG